MKLELVKNPYKLGEQGAWAGFKQGSENQLKYNQPVVDKLEARIKELEQLVEVQLKETANLGKQLDESMASYYKAEDRAEVAIGAYNTCYDRELNLKAEIDGYAKMNQSLVRDCCDLTDEVANAESVAWDLQKQIEVLKAQLGEKTKSMREMIIYLLEQWEDAGKIMDEYKKQLDACTKPDKGEVK
jgi:DNA repair exonuclease SbcCD ATPase subunit